ncbi:MAG: 50S ribosomal protein L10 [Planctomycetes bacterium]|nr:50S ribosomal protein L10 [Planctomycetota bacterium]
MSKPVKNLIRKEIGRRLEGVSDVAVVSVIGIDGNTNNRLRGELLDKGIHVMVVKNSMARQAFEDLGLGAAGDLLDGPCAVAYGAESVVDVVREILDRAKQIPELSVKGAYMDGEVFAGPARVAELSKFPTRIEALGKLSGAALGPGSKLAGALIGPGGVIAGILKALEERGESTGQSAEA